MLTCSKKWLELMTKDNPIQENMQQQRTMTTTSDALDGRQQQNDRSKLNTANPKLKSQLQISRTFNNEWNTLTDNRRKITKNCLFLHSYPSLMSIPLFNFFFYWVFQKSVNFERCFEILCLPILWFVSYQPLKSPAMKDLHH